MRKVDKLKIENNELQILKYQAKEIKTAINDKSANADCQLPKVLAIFIL